MQTWLDEQFHQVSSSISSSRASSSVEATMRTSSASGSVKQLAQSLEKTLNTGGGQLPAHETRGTSFQCRK